MSLNAQKGEKKQRPIAPIGAHVGVCFQIVDCGTHMKRFNNQEPKATSILQIGWEFVNLPPAVFDETKGPQPLAIFQEYTTSINEKAKLYQCLLSWRGVAPQDLAKELPIFLGQACLINVIHNPDKQVPNIKYANIANGGAGIMRLPQGMQVGALKNPKILFNLDTYSHDQFILLPEWLQNKIKNSLEWSGIVAKHGPPPQPQQTGQTNQQQGFNHGFNNQQPQNQQFGGQQNQGFNQQQNTGFQQQNQQPANTQQAQQNNGIVTGNPFDQAPPF